MMDKNSLVRAFFEKGKLLTPDVLERVNEQNMDVLKGEGVFITAIPKGDATTVLFPLRKDHLTIDDYTAFYKSKYEGIASLLRSRVSPTSVSHLGKEDHLIGPDVRECLDDAANLLRSSQDPSG